MGRNLFLLTVSLMIGLAGNSLGAWAQSRCEATVAAKSCREGHDFMEQNFIPDKSVRSSMKALHGYCDTKFKDQNHSACMLGGFDNLLHKIKNWTR